MIILTYRRLAPAASLQVGQSPPTVFVEQFTDSSEEAARSKATFVTREGAVDVFLSRVYEKYSVEKSIKVEEIK